MRTADHAEVESRRFRRTEKSFQEDEVGLGLFGSIQKSLATTLAVIESRVELFTLEFKELKCRALALVAWGLALTFFIFLTVVSITATVLFLFWEQATAVLIGFSAIFVIAAIGSFFAAKKQLREIPFGDTVDQLRKDRAMVSQELS